MTHKDMQMLREAGSRERRVPEGWGEFRLSSVSELQRGFDLPNNQRVKGTVPVVSSGGITGFHAEARSKAPGVVTGRYGSIGDVFFIEEDYWPLNTALWVKNFHGNDEKFIYYLLSSFDFKKFSDKTGVPGVNRNDLHAVKVAVPPLPEQKKIAQILSTWDKAITTTEQLLVNSQQQKKALMQQLLTGKQRLLDQNGKRFEGEWESYELGDWIRDFSEKSVTNDQHEVLTSSRTGLVKQSEYFTESRISQRENAGFNVLPPRYITYRSRSDDGQFFFNRNEFSFTGIISTYYPVFHFPDGDSTFFLNYLNRSSSAFAGYSVGTSQKVLSLNVLKGIKARLPKKEEQQKIAAVLSSADQEITTLQQKLNALKQEKKALMQQLLTGKLRVVV